MIRSTLLVWVFVLAASAILTASPGTAMPQASSWLRAPARTLASLDCRCTPSAARIARYRRILDKLAARCKEARGRLAYISKVATDGLAQQSIRRTNFWMLNEVYGTISPGVRVPQPCRYVFALVVDSIS